MARVTSGLPGGKKHKTNILPSTIFEVVPISEKMLVQMAPALEDAMTELTGQLRKVEDQDDPVALARAFVALHRIREYVKGILGDESSMMSRLYNRYKTEVMDEAFARAGMPNVPLDEGFRVQLANKYSVSIPAASKPEAFKWLRDNGLPDFTQQTVNAQTLSSTIQTMVEETNVEPPSELFTIHRARHASVVQLKTK